MIALPLAHGGGAPEALSLAVPLLALGLYVALQSRARRAAERDADDQEVGEPAGPA